MTFAELQQKWSQVRVESELKKADSLLFSADEGQVRATFDLLLSLDECGLCEVLVGVPSCHGCLRATVLAHLCVCAGFVTVPLICLSVSDKAHSVPHAFRFACRVCCVLRQIQCRMLAAVCVASAFAW